MTRRKLVSVVRGVPTIDGAGVHLRRVLGKPTIEAFDPFLMLDGFDSTNPEDYIRVSLGIHIVVSKQLLIYLAARLNMGTAWATKVLLASSNVNG